MYFEKKLYKILNEQTVKFKDKDGKDHEIDMDTAKQYKQDIDGGDRSDYKKMAVKAAGLDKDDSQGDAGKEPPKKVAKIDTNPFDDEPKGDDKPRDKGDGTHTSSSKIDSKFPEFELEEEPFEADDYDEEMENEIADEITAHFSKNGEDEEMADLVRDESEKLVAKYQDPDGVPNEKRSMKAYRDDLIKNVYMAMGEKSAEAGFDAEDEPAGEPKAAPKKSVANDEINDFIGTIADAGERGAGFSDERVRRSVTRELQQVKDKGGSVEDIAAELKKQAEYMNPEDFELADQAAEEIFGDKIPHGISDDEIGTALESKQPFRENYNRLFKGRDVL